MRRKKHASFMQPLMPARTTMLFLALIAAVHTILALGLGVFGTWYEVFISLLYGWFNLPLVFTPFVLYQHSLASMNAVNVAVHLAYWYVLACALRQAKQHWRHACYLLLYFVALAVLGLLVLSLRLASAL